MKTLDRYIAGIFIRNLVLAIVSMSVLFLFQALFSDLYTPFPINQILVYNFLNLPQICVQMSPPAVLLATVLTLSGLARTHELVACYSIGWGLRRMMALILSVVVVVSLLMLVMQDRVLPPVFRTRINYKWRVMEKRTDFFLDIKRDKIWYRSKNMIYNLQRFDTHSQMIHGISVYTFDEDFNLIQVIGAAKAEFSPRGWKLLQGNVRHFLRITHSRWPRTLLKKRYSSLKLLRIFRKLKKKWMVSS